GTDGPYPLHDARGPRAPRSWLDNMTSCGLIACSSCHPSPSASIVPVELFSMTTSADATSRRTSATPSGDFKSTPNERFDRLDDTNDGLVRFAPMSRMKSG